MVDGAASLMTMEWAFRAMGVWETERPGTNLLDTGAPFYDVYECADGKWLALGAIEAQFYAELLRGLGLADDPDLPHQMDRSRWGEMKQRFADVIRTKTRDEWWAVFEGTDACVAPVLSPGEALVQPHMTARRTFVDDWGVDQPAPAPRFSRTTATLDKRPSAPGADTDVALAAWGFSPDDIAKLREAGAVA